MMRRFSRLTAAGMLLVVASQSAADTIPKGMIRYRAGVMMGTDSALGFGFTHGLDATLHLGEGNRQWLFALGWEIEWGCHGQFDDTEATRLTLCFGPDRVDAVTTSIKTLSARPVLRIKRRFGRESNHMLSFSTGVGLMRVNTPLRNNQQTFVSPAGALSYEKYWGRLNLTVTVRFEGPPFAPGILGLLIGVGYGG